MRAQCEAPRTGEEGIALLMAVLLLLLVSGIGIAAIDHSGDEAAVTGRSRRTQVTFYAADAAIHLAIARLSQVPVNLAGFTSVTADGTTLRTGPRTAGAPQPIQRLSSGAPPDGFGLPTGGGGGYTVDVYQTTVTAIGPDSSTTELEGKFWSLQAGAGGY